MVGAETLGVQVQAATGLIMLVAGLATLVATRARRHTVSFSLLLVLWGGFLLAGNLGALAFHEGDLAGAQKLLILHSVLQGVAFLPLAVFALSYPPSRSVSLSSPTTVAFLLVPLVAVLATVLVDPSLFHEGFGAMAGSLGSLWGPGKLGVFVLFRGAIYAAMIRLVFTLEDSNNRIVRRQALYVLLGLALFIGYESTEDLLIFAGPWASGGPAPGVDILVFTATAALGLATLAWVYLRLRQAKRALYGGPARLVPIVFVGSVALGAIPGGLLAWGTVSRLPADSVWRLGAAGLLLHSVTRFEEPRELPGLPSWAAGAGAIAGAAGILLTLQLALEALLGSSIRALVALQGLLLGALGVALVRQPEALRAWLEQLRESYGPRGDANRQMEVYEAALLEDREPDVLAQLRDRFSISDPEHELVRRLTQDGPQAHGSDGTGPSVEAGRLEAGQIVCERYRVEEEIGRGAFTHVYRAWDVTLDRPVALKVLDAEVVDDPVTLRGILHEARVARRISHPHVVDIEGLELVDGRPMLVLEHMAGGSLADRLPEDGLEAREAARVLDGVLEGLDHLHDRGVLHRDLKPSNVLLTSDGEAKIGDLGLAHAWDPTRTQQLGPDTGLREGTPAYMSPEALTGRPLSPTSDVYAAGAILAEALTGSHYLGLEAASHQTVRRAVLRAMPDLDGLEAGLAEVCRTALAKEPDDRYESAGAMREALLEALGPGSGAPSEEKPAARPSAADGDARLDPGGSRPDAA